MTKDLIVSTTPQETKVALAAAAAAANSAEASGRAQNNQAGYRREMTKVLERHDHSLGARLAVSSKAIQCAQEAWIAVVDSVAQDVQVFLDAVKTVFFVGGDEQN